MLRIVIFVSLLLAVVSTTAASTLEFDIDFHHNSGDTVVYLLSLEGVNQHPDPIYGLEVEFTYAADLLVLTDVDFASGTIDSWGGMVWACDSIQGSCVMAGAGASPIGTSGVFATAYFTKTAAAGETVNGALQYVDLRVNEDRLDPNSVVTSVSEIEAPLPDGFSLSQNYPNPFNPSTSIEFTLPRRFDVSIRIFNVLGQEVYTEKYGRLSSGTYRFDWNAVDHRGAPVASGMYFYRLEAGMYWQTRSMILLK